MVKKEERFRGSKIRLKAELGDNLFVLLCLANSMGIDMTESFNETMKSLIQEIKSIRKKVNIKYLLYLDLIKIKNIHQ